VITSRVVTPALIMLGLLHSCASLGQAISIQIRDKVSGQQIPMVHLFDAKTRSLFVSDEHGKAEILRLEGDGIYLNLSHVSYNDTVVYIDKEENEHTIYLSEYSQILEEVIIGNEKSPENLLQSAIANVGNIFSDENTALLGNYYEKLTSSGNELYTIHAKIVGKKSPYIKKHSWQKLKIHESTYLSNIDKFQSDSLDLNKAIRYAGGYNIVHFMDLVKTDIDFLNPSSFKHYKFEFVDSLTKKNHRTYISFEPKTSKRGYYKGLLAIDQDSLAIGFCSYELSELGRQWAKANFIHGEIARSTLTYRDIMGQVEYRYANSNGKWYLKNCFYKRIKSNINFKEDLTTETFFETEEIQKNIKNLDGLTKLPKRAVLIEMTK